MGMTGTERQQHFIELAATHAEDFKTRVTQHDRENTFPFENVKAMKDSGYTNMTMPAELGGGGVNVLDFALAQERLAQSDGPMAVAINMHLLTVGIVADLWRLGDQKLRPFLERIAQERLIVAAGTNDPRMSSSIGLGGLIDTTRRAEKVDGGYVINGRAGFGTMSACADFLGQTAHYDDPEQGPRCLLFFVPTNTPGIHLQTNWDTWALRRPPGTMRSAGRANGHRYPLTDRRATIPTTNSWPPRWRLGCGRHGPWWCRRPVRSVSLPFGLTPRSWMSSPVISSGWKLPRVSWTRRCAWLGERPSFGRARWSRCIGIPAPRFSTSRLPGMTGEGGWGSWCLVFRRTRCPGGCRDQGNAWVTGSGYSSGCRITAQKKGR